MPLLTRSHVDIAEVLQKKPYTFKTKGKFGHKHVIIYDRTEISECYMSLADVTRVVQWMNAAYVEGYLQREREIV